MARPNNKPTKPVLKTDRQIGGVKPPKRGRVEYRIAKAPGLVLRVTDTGVKSWALWLRDVGRGRYRLKTLGHYPAISLAKACAEARRLSSAAENGEALFGAPRRQPTFADLSEDYLKRHARPKKRPQTRMNAKSRSTCCRSSAAGWRAI